MPIHSKKQLLADEKTENHIYSPVRPFLEESDDH